ncbi:Glutaredoxin-1 [Smittium mucronatum]|uniref:Glutaredoxin-1 n=1 Tax=Smittium mucronatum TaxID=133383 RepID=A0A1R0GYX3_9FUNG|nr:Glutaredoxin-1 [Smittium mucronatum]
MGSMNSSLKMSPQSIQDMKAIVDPKIDQNKVMVFSKSYCPYCSSAKSALKDLGVDFSVVELDQVNNGSDIQSYLYEITGQRTVPNIFIKKAHVGGCDDLLRKIRSGEIQKMLE